MQFGQRKLDRLIGRQSLAERFARLGIGHAFIDAILRCADTGCGLANTVFMHKMLRQHQTSIARTKQCRIRHPHIRQRNARVIGRHIERPKIFLDFETGRIRRYQKAADTARGTVIAGGAGKNHVVIGNMETGIPHFLTIDQPAVHAVALARLGARFHPCRIRAVVGFGQAKSHAVRSGQHAVNENILLFGRAEIAEHQDLGEIADNRAFILQIIVQPQALFGEVFTNNRHCQIGAVLSAIFFRQGKAQMSGRVGTAAHFAQQFLPLMAGLAVIVPIGAGIFAPVVKKPDIVVLFLQRFDLACDKSVQFGQICFDIFRNFKIHGFPLSQPGAALGAGVNRALHYVCLY